jgi:hypothetical protein
MKLSLVSWNGTNINSGAPYYAAIRPGQLASLSRNPVIVNRAGDYPSLTGVVKNASAIVINVWTAPGQDINTYRELLKSYFFGDEILHNLIAIDENDSDKQYYRSGFPVTMVEEGGAPNSWFITIATEYPYWRQVTATADSWDVTGTSDSFELTNAGNLPAQPVFTITPTTTKTEGYKYWRYVPIYSNVDKTYSAPMDITDGGLDVQTLIDAGKMQADGDDFRVWMDGSFADRWLYEMDSDSDAAKCWVNMSLGPRQEGVTSAAFDSDDTTITFTETAANLEFLRSLTSATNYTLYIDQEAVVFDADNIDTLNYQITGLTRGQKNTTATSHLLGAIVRYIEHDLYILYGDSDAAAPDVDSDLEPIISLASTNGAWSWTNYYNEISARPGAWKGEVRASRTRLSYVFTDSDNAFANPSNVLGLAERAAQDFTIPHENATLDWLFSHPAGITDVTYSGDKYRTGSWPGIVGLQKLQPNTVWFTVENEATPVVALAWESFGPRSESLSGTYEAIRFAIDGVLSSVINEMAGVQFHTVTTTFDSDNLPAITVGAEATINFFDFKITNTTTGEWIKVTTPCPVNSALVVDCENRIAYLADGRSVPVRLSTERADWLNLSAGVNGLLYEDDGTVAVTIVVSHRDKVL